MTTTFYLDTGAFFLVAGLDDSGLFLLNQAISKNEIELCLTHVQIDEHGDREKSYEENFVKAMNKLTAKKVKFLVESTKEDYWDISRWGLAEWGNDLLYRIDDELRLEIEKCNKKNKNASYDALIAISSLNHDYFITTDICLTYAWKAVILNNQKNKEALEKNYAIPQIIKRKTPKSVLNTLLELKNKLK